MISARRAISAFIDGVLLASLVLGVMLCNYCAGMVPDQWPKGAFTVSILLTCFIPPAWAVVEGVLQPGVGKSITRMRLVQMGGGPANRYQRAAQLLLKYGRTLAWPMVWFPWGGSLLTVLGCQYEWSHVLGYSILLRLVGVWVGIDALVLVLSGEALHNRIAGLRVVPPAKARSFEVVVN